MNYTISNYINIEQLTKFDLINLRVELEKYLNQNIPPIYKQNVVNSYNLINSELAQFDIKNDNRKKLVLSILNNINNSVIALEENNAGNFFMSWKSILNAASEIDRTCLQKYTNKKATINRVILINEELNKSPNLQLSLNDDRFRTYISSLLTSSKDTVNQFLEEFDSTSETLPVSNVINGYFTQIQNLMREEQSKNINAINNYSANTPNELSFTNKSDVDFSKRIYTLSLSSCTGYFKLKNNILITATEDEIKEGTKVPIGALKDEDDNSGKSKQVSKAKEWDLF